MATLVDMDWTAERLQRPDVLVLDPRLPMRYLQGHLPGAVSVPALRAFDADGTLSSPDQLAAWLGAAGLRDDLTPVVYDGHDGQRGALLVWVLEYLGRQDVCLLDVFYEAWRAAGRPIVYRAAAPQPATFTARVNPSLRADLAVVQRGDHALLDVRSREEYEGAVDFDPRPGHIPGARHLAWRELAGPAAGSYLAPRQQLQRLLADRGIDPARPVITYCRGGIRAALGYVALQQLGCPVRLFDGSYQAWAAADLPVERAGSPSTGGP